MPQQQDAESNSRASRPRSNTSTGFSPLSNLRSRLGRTDPATAPTAAPIQALRIEALIEALTPPAVPSLSYARSLVVALNAAEGPLPQAAINPILGSLCSANTPTKLHAAGLDVLTAYWNHCVSVWNTADKVTYFALLTADPRPWVPDLWEARFNALQALTRSGSELIGIESTIFGVVTPWIGGAFDELVNQAVGMQQEEKADRERAIDNLSGFLLGINQIERVSRVPTTDLANLLTFYAGLVQRGLDVPLNQPSHVSESPPGPEPRVSTPTRMSLSHRRHPSSTSVHPASPASAGPPPPPSRTPTEIALTWYMSHLTAQLRVLSRIHLDDILPLLFRALSHYASPLPRLSLSHGSLHPASSYVENDLADLLFSLFTGLYSATCTAILKTYLRPKLDASTNAEYSIQVSIGAFRTLRILARRVLVNRLARSLIAKQSSFASTPSGAPGNLDMERDLMELAWPKEDLTSWEPGKVARILARSVKAWTCMEYEARIEDLTSLREMVLDEIGGMVKDMLQEFDVDDDMDDETASAVGETLFGLAGYIQPLQNQDGTPLVIPRSAPTTAPTRFLRTLSSILSRDSEATPLEPPLTATLLFVSEHLVDAETVQLITAMLKQNDLSPATSKWLKNWESIFAHATLYDDDRPLTRTTILYALKDVHNSVRDIRVYRRPFTELLIDFWKRQIDIGPSGDGNELVWRILADEVVLRTVEVETMRSEANTEEDEAAVVTDERAINTIIELLTTVALTAEEREIQLSALINAASPPPYLPPPSSTSTSPILSRVQSGVEIQHSSSPLPSVMAVFSSLTSSHSSRSTPQQQEPQAAEAIREAEAVAALEATQAATLTSRPVCAVIGLVCIFAQLAFTPYSLSESNLKLVIRVYYILLKALSDARSSRARITVLQFLLRLRADRNHRIYYVDASYDRDGNVGALVSLINRVRPPATSGPQDPEPANISDVRRARSRIPHERDGRRASRGRGVQTSMSTSSRSRSRAPNADQIVPPVPPPTMTRETLWQYPDVVPFGIEQVDVTSERLISYDPEGPDRQPVLPTSAYLATVLELLEQEQDWEVLSYVLCHLPTQLANKHLFCGPKTRQVIVKIMTLLCASIIEGKFASRIDYWPGNLKARDAQGLAYHTLSVLISYRRCFDAQLQHALVEVFLAGLSGQPSSVKCCLHALCLAAFEIRPSMTKYLSRILEKLSQIMTNPVMAVHILNFLSMVASLPPLYTNFTEADFKMVFGVALQYLQHHNRPDTELAISWALSQHLRILCYYVVYVWFLAVKLPDRPRHVRFITRQLLLANHGKSEIDEPTEVCFDWLARYTYASADPRPANSVFSEIVMNPVNGQHSSGEIAVQEKTWILGNSIVTIRTLARRGWIEVISRRPSGYTKFLCRSENVPVVGPGEVDPDFTSLLASLMMDRDRPEDNPSTPLPADMTQELQEIFVPRFDPESALSPPDPITGYVWSGTAPSQRRKDVSIDPSFFALQLSSYPESQHRSSVVHDSSLLPPLFRSLDRMPVIDTHKVGILYAAPGQQCEEEILRNTHGSPAYTRFLEGLGRLINLRGQVDVYAGGLDPEEDGEYAYAWWDDIGQILYHAATMMPTNDDDPYCTNKKRHIGNDFVRIVWNDSGLPYRFDTLNTQFQFVNIVIEPHSRGAIAAFSNSMHENEYFKVTVQRAVGMTEFCPVGDFTLISAENLPLLVRQLSLLSDWFASVFQSTENDTVQRDIPTNWRSRLQTIKRFRQRVQEQERETESSEGLMQEETARDFTTGY